MELHALRVFRTVADERSFSRAAEKLARTQPAISLSVQRLEAEVGDKLIDRSGKELLLTDAGQIVYDYARRFENLETELGNALAEMRDNASGVLTVGANESTSLYLLQHIVTYRRLYPKVKVRIRRCLSSRIPDQLIDGELEMGVISFEPQDARLESQVIYTDRLTFVVSPEHRFANRESVSISELGMETFVAHNVISPYREIVLREFQRRRISLNMDVEMPTVETIRRLVQRNEGVAFLPKMCVEQETAKGLLKEVPIEELHVERKVHLVYPAKRNLSHAARAFLEVVKAPEPAAAG
jgi:DNA-binding transcriptional LysR family regulator